MGPVGGAPPTQVIKCFYLKWVSYQMLSPNLLIRSCDFCLSFCLCDVFCLLICDIIPSLHLSDESHLIMVYDLFNVLLDAVCQYFFEVFSIYIHQRYWPVVFFVVSSYGLGISIMPASKKESGGLPFPWIFGV